MLWPEVRVCLLDRDTPLNARLTLAHDHVQANSMTEEVWRVAIEGLVAACERSKRREEVKGPLTKLLWAALASLKSNNPHDFDSNNLICFDSNHDRRFTVASYLAVKLGEEAAYQEALMAASPNQDIPASLALAELALRTDHPIDALILGSKCPTLGGWQGLLVKGLTTAEYTPGEVKHVAMALGGRSPLLVQETLSALYLWIRHYEPRGIGFALWLSLSLPSGHRRLTLDCATCLLALPGIQWPDDPALWAQLCRQLNENPMNAVDFEYAEYGTGLLRLQHRPRMVRLAVRLPPFIVCKHGHYRLGSLYLPDPQPNTPKTTATATLGPKSPGKEVVPSIAELKERMATLQMALPKPTVKTQIDRKGYYVIDTNILMGGVDWAALLDTPLKLAIPLAVAEELHSMQGRSREKEALAKEALELLANPFEHCFISYLHSDGSLHPRIIDGETERPSSLSIRNTDDVILAATKLLSAREPVCLVSDDVNMQLKAEAMQIAILDRRSFLRSIL